MSYQFQRTAPLSVELFTAAGQRQPLRNAFHRAYLPFLGYMLLLMVFLIAGCTALGALAIKWFDVPSGIATVLVSVAPFGLAILAWFGFMNSMIRGMYRRMLESPLYDGSVRYEVSEKRFTMSSDTARWSVEWPAMDKVTRHAKGIFMYAGGFINVIPQETAPADQYEDMWADIKRWFGAAQ